ncbi:MAG: hypothetical protein LBL74_03495 [Bacteroidales bacterium]|jgi:hypothetical protein|nr:hypothetical protein [Bacteroidales bacterium]
MRDALIHYAKTKGCLVKIKQAFVRLKQPFIFPKGCFIFSKGSIVGATRAFDTLKPRTGATE